MIIFDSSTLILLAKINLLDLFISSFKGRILIPEKVMIESCTKGKDETQLINSFINEGNIEVVKIKDTGQLNKLMEDFNIDSGEAEAIVLAIENRTVIVGTDDRNAIKACKILKIEFTTAIAILIRSLEKKLIDKDIAIYKLQKLQAISRYSNVIIEDAKKQINRSS